MVFWPSCSKASMAFLSSSAFCLSRSAFLSSSSFCSLIRYLSNRALSRSRMRRSKVSATSESSLACLVRSCSAASSPMSLRRNLRNVASASARKWAM